MLKENELLKTNLESGKAGPKTATETKEVEDLKSALAESNRKLAEQSAHANVLLTEQQDLQKRFDSVAGTSNELANPRSSTADTNVGWPNKLVRKSLLVRKTPLLTRVNQLVATAAATEALRAGTSSLTTTYAAQTTNAVRRRRPIAATEGEARIAALHPTCS